MSEPQRSRLFDYGFAIAVVGMVGLFEYATWPIFEAFPFALFCAGIAMAAFRGGLGPGLLATLLAVLATEYLLGAPADLLPTEAGATVRLAGLVGVGIVISAASARLRASRTQVRQILENISEGFVSLDHKWRYRFVNRRAAQLVGRPQEELVGRPIFDAFPNVAELPPIGDAQRAMRDRVPVRTETYHPALGRWFESNFHPAHKGLTILFRDITERKSAEEALRLSEQRLRTTLDQAVTGIAEIDLGGRYLLANERYCHMVGRSAEELLRLRMQDVTHAEDLPRNLELLGRVMVEGESFVVEKRFVRPTGDCVWVRDHVSLVRDSAGRPQYAFEVVEDITEWKQAEAERDAILEHERRARAEAEAASRSKDAFLVTVSHELRSPLTAMLSSLQLIGLEASDASGRPHALETIERNAKTMARLVGDLLDLSRIISGKLELEAVPVELTAVIRAALDDIRPEAAAKQIELRSRLDPEGGLVTGDATRLQQVMRNLLANATQFTPGGGRIEIALEREAGRVAVSVTDTGIGIRPELLPHVFEWFRQLESPAQPRSGLGLGLAIVRHLVEMHGGEVHAESAGEGKGSKFSFCLPVRASQEAVHAAAPAGVRTRLAPGSPSVADPPPVLQGLKILVVDDEVEARRLLGEVLTERGAQVLSAATGAEARAAFETWKPDLLISDIGMSEESGYTMMRAIRALESQRGGRVPAIALTAYAQLADQLQAFSAGYDLHVPKPVEPVALISLIAHITARRQGGLLGAS